MKTLKRLPLFLLAMVMCISMLSMSAQAASTSQDGLEITLITDKDDYAQNEQITATLIVKNTNDFAVTNVYLEQLIPDGYKLPDGSSATRQAESLGAGKTIILTITYTSATAPTGVNNEGDNGSANDSSETGGNTTNNGDETNDDAINNGTESNSSTNNGNGAGNGSSTNNNAIPPKTDDENNIVVPLVLLILSAVCLIAFAIRKKKIGQRLLSFFLCFTILCTLMPTNIAQATSEFPKSCSVETIIKIDGSELKIQAKVTYSVDNKAGYDETTDSDGDGLIDLDEETLGTDPTKPDTDGDGLTDYEEIILGTDPLTPNEYDTTIDSDSDGFTDIEEVQIYGTDPYLSDTDNDGLSDYNEIHIYGTDPLNPDTDGDTLSDGFEIEHGLDPTKASTDGITNDSELKIEQEISEIGISLDLRDKGNVAQPSISGIATGELANNVFLATDTDSAFNDNRSVVGCVVYVDGNDDYMSGLSLTFDLSSYEGDLNNLTIVTLNEDGTFELIESTLNQTTLTAQIENSGSYCVLDLNEFLKNLGFDLDSYWNTNETSTISAYSFESGYASDSNANAIIIKKSENQASSEGDLDDTAYKEETGTTIDAYSLIPEDSEESNKPDTSVLDSVSRNDAINVNEIIIDEKNTSIAEDTGSIATYSIVEELESYESQVNSDLLDKLNETNALMLSSSPANGQADIVFVIDTTGSMYDTINNVVTNVISFTTTLSENYNVNANFALVDFKDLEEDGAGTTVVVKNGSSNWFSDVNTFISKVSTLSVDGGGDYEECDIDALETARRLDFRSSASKFIILITDAPYKTANDYGISSMDEEIRLLATDGIITSVVTSSDCKTTYQSLYKTTGGIYADIDSSTFSSSLVSLADMIGETTSDGTWVILKHGYRYVKLTDETDQDGDGLSTTYELGKEEEINLTILIKAILAMHNIPYEKYIGKTTITVYNAKSDPTQADTDSDGIIDAEDDAPWTKGKSDGITGKLYLITCYGSTFSSGHSFFAYQSYINDTINFSGLANGWQRTDSSKNWSSDNLTRDYTPTSNYAISRNGYVCIGNGALGSGASSGASDGSVDGSAGDANGVNYNMETYKFIIAGKPTGIGVDFSYLSNTYITEEITNATLEKLIAYLSQDSVNYWSLSHNCAKVAADGWNYISSTNVSAYGLQGWHIFATPSALRDNLRKISGHAEDWQISEAF